MRHHKISLELSNVELQAVRAALADYACTAYRRALELKQIGAAARLASEQHAHEDAACRVLGALPQAIH